MFIHGVVGHVLERLLVQFTGPTQAALDQYTARHPAEQEHVAQLLAEIAQRRQAPASEPAAEGPA